MLNWQQWLNDCIEEKSDPLSHFEPDPFTFHPSQLTYCKRQCYLSKLSIKENKPKTLRIFEMGNIIHEYLQDHLSENDDEGRFSIEKPLTVTIPSHNDITLTGHCDVFDNALNIVYDFKTRNGWYKFDPPNERHMIQIELYQYMLWRTLLDEGKIDKDTDIYGQVVYVNKADLEMRQVPEDTLTVFNPSNQEYVKDILEYKANTIGRTIEKRGLPTCKDEIPFSKCDCWVCNNEGNLTFDHLKEYN